MNMVEVKRKNIRGLISIYRIMGDKSGLKREISVMFKAYRLAQSSPRKVF